MPPNFCSSTSSSIAGDLEGLAHDVGPVVADGAGRQLDAVADDIVLEGRGCRAGPWSSSAVEPALRHRERVVREVDLLLLLVPLVHREIDDPAELEPVLVDEVELLADPVARLAGELVELRRPARRRRTPRRRSPRPSWSPRIASLRSAPIFLATGPGACPPRPRARRCSPAPAGPRSCAQPFMRSQKARLPPPWAPGSPTPRPSDLRRSCAANTLKPEPREMLGHLLHLDRIAQVRLVGAIFADRLARRRCAGIPPSPACRRQTPRTPRAAPARPPRRRRPASTKLISISSW